MLVVSLGTSPRYPQVYLLLSARYGARKTLGNAAICAAGVTGYRTLRVTEKDIATPEVPTICPVPIGLGAS